MDEKKTAIPAQYRDINTITAEIRLIQENVQLYVSQATMKIGEKLTEAKELLPHGEFTEWAKSEFGWSERKTQQIMQIYREFSGSQTNLFAPEIKAQTFADLPFSKLLLLTYVPESEREQFVEENNVGDMSVRDMEKLIKEKKAAEERETALKVENEQLKRDISDREKELKSICDSADSYTEEAVKTATAEIENRLIGERNAAIREADNKVASAETKMKEAEIKLKKAQEEAKRYAEEAAKSRQDIAELKANPEVPQELIDKLKSQFEAQAKENEEKFRQAQQEAEELKKKLSLASPETQLIKIKLENIERDFDELMKIAAGAEGEKAAKYRKVVEALLLRLHERANA